MIKSIQNKMRIRLGIIALAVFSVGLSWFLCERNVTYNRLFISLDTNNIPSTEVEIQGHRYDLNLSLGSKFPLSLNKTALSQLKKKETGKIWAANLAGEAIELQTYQLEKIILGNLTFKNVLVVENEGEHEPNTIGKPLLLKYNLLLDFRKSTLIMSNRFKNLEKVGYGREDWVQVPIKIGYDGVVLQAETDLGVKRFSLGVATANSIIKSSLHHAEIGTESPCLTSKIFAIGGIEFGAMNLHSYPISSTEFPEEVDGILGMDFLYKHLVYLDFEEQCAYVTK